VRPEVKKTVHPAFPWVAGWIRVQGPAPSGAPTQYRVDFCQPCEPSDGEHVDLSKYATGGVWWTRQLRA
jgi:hypothetical protein